MGFTWKCDESKAEQNEATSSAVSAVELMLGRIALLCVHRISYLKWVAFKLKVFVCALEVIACSAKYRAFVTFMWLLLWCDILTDSWQWPVPAAATIEAAACPCLSWGSSMPQALALLATVSRTVSLCGDPGLWSN